MRVSFNAGSGEVGVKALEGHILQKKTLKISLHIKSVTLKNLLTVFATTLDQDMF